METEFTHRFSRFSERGWLNSEWRLLTAVTLPG